MEKVKRRIGYDSFYGFYRHGFEDVLHVLRYCPASSDIWEYIAPINKLSWFYLRGLVE